MSKLLSVIMIVALLTLVGGCQSQPYSNTHTLINTNKPDHLSNLITPTTPSSLESPSNNEERYIISHSNIDAWKELEAKVFLNELTYHRDYRVLSKIEDDRMVEYSIQFPDSWTLNYTVFNEGADQKKTAELFPVFLLEPEDESEILDFKIPEEYTEIELVAKEMVTFGEYKGFKIILKVTTTETWYPHTYYLTDGIYVFGISLYSYSEKRDEAEQKLFDDIVSTFRFKPSPLHTL